MLQTFQYFKLCRWTLCIAALSIGLFSGQNVMGICIWDQKKQQTFSNSQTLKDRCPVKLGLNLRVEKRYNSREKYERWNNENKIWFFLNNYKFSVFQLFNHFLRNFWNFGILHTGVNSKFEILFGQNTKFDFIAWKLEFGWMWILI